MKSHIRIQVNEMAYIVPREKVQLIHNPHNLREHYLVQIDGHDDMMPVSAEQFEQIDIMLQT